jgi:cysteine-rich repeat protein
MRCRFFSLVACLWTIAAPSVAQPAAWTCADNNYDNSDGCDCGCTVADPDCVSDAVVLCEYFHCEGDTVVDPGDSLTCVTDVCGNGIRGRNEACDDGGDPDGGCSDDCRQVSADFQCGDVGCTRSRCGDAVWQSFSEQCDDGNIFNGDGCNDRCDAEPGFVCYPNQNFDPGGNVARSTVCQRTFCGNNSIEFNFETRSGETCEDFNVNAGDGCDADCQEEPGYFCPPFQFFCQATTCNDGVLSGDQQWGAGESCEDGNTVPGDGCDENCNVEPGYDCYDENFGTPTDCRVPICGDGLIDYGIGGENCDDNNNSSDDGCSAQCQLEPGFDCSVTPCVRIECGNGVQQCNPVTGQCEQCDDGNILSGDGCSTFCFLEPGFSCNFVQPTQCTAIECGNGVMQCDNNFFFCEQCDDGNANDGDGCSSRCDVVEPGFICPQGGGRCRLPVCGDGIVERDPFTGQTIENCDDGNSTSGDGCDELCDAEAGFECFQPGEPCAVLPDGWLCSTQFYDVDDGCDCGCGSIDPDCAGTGIDSCSFNQCFNANLVAIDPCDIGRCVNREEAAANLLLCGEDNPGEGEGEDGDGEGEGIDTVSLGGAGCQRSASVGFGLLLLLGRRRRPTHHTTTMMAALMMWTVSAHAQPVEWTCPDNNYDNSDGCDCGCGVADPDCVTDDVRECAFSRCEPPLVVDVDDTASCATDVCGNGVRGGTETCDDGGDPDGGCSDDCGVVAPGFTCDTFGCQRSRCGDGLVTFPERCDDTNNRNGDGCSAGCIDEDGFICTLNQFDQFGRPFGASSCRRTFCGDFSVEFDYSTRSGESCDDGNTQGGDGCSASCEQEPGFWCQQGSFCVASTCGDGTVSGDIFPPSGEQCDDGNVSDGDGCDASCQPEYGYACFDEFNYAFTPCYVPFCGDGHISRSLVGLISENCDDGNASSGDGCTVDCQPEPDWDCNSVGPGRPCVRVECGNSVIQCGNFGCEGCDDGNEVSGDGCDGTCQFPEAGFICPPTGGPCRRPTCGDGFVDRDPFTGQFLERCDDSNNVAGDGCDDNCELEAGFECAFVGQPCVELPDGWLCSAIFFDTDDGCDCGCGSTDPDCPSTAASDCSFNHCFDGNLVAYDPCDPTSCVTEQTAIANAITCPIDVPTGEGEGEGASEGEGEDDGAPDTLSLGGAGCPRGGLLLPLWVFAVRWRRKVGV